MKREMVEQNTIFLTIAGSRAYGTNIATSDYDYRGVCIVPDKSLYFGTGLNKFSQMDKGFDDDKVIYDIRKFIALAIENNPNIIELLFTNEQHYIISTKWFNKIIKHRDKFLSKNIKYRFSGYSFAQLKRIKRHRGYLMNPPKEKPERSAFGLPDRKLISSDNMGAFQWLIATLLKGTADYLNISEELRIELKNVNYIGAVQRGIPDNCLNKIQELTGASDEWIEAMTREKAYINAMNEWNAYQTWKNNRNKDRAEMERKFGYDCKFAMHLVRLMRMGMEILETGKVNVFRPDREELKAIRNGAWSYDRLVEYADKYEKRLEELYATTKLPKQPNRKFLDTLCVNIIDEYINQK
jgi:predicted nucleotidyltransferase